MTALIIRLPAIQSGQFDRPERCPSCGSPVLQRWGAAFRKYQDSVQLPGKIYRYRCADCGRTFRYYSQEFDQDQMDFLLHRLAALAWAFGLSSRQVELIFKDLGIEISHMTVWRDGDRLIKQVHYPKPPCRYEIDQLLLMNRGKGVGTSIIIDLGHGKTAVLGKVGEVDTRIIQSWIEPFISGTGIQIEQSSE